MLVLYFISLPCFLLVLAVSAATERVRYPRFQRPPDPYEIARALGRYTYIRQATKVFVGLLIVISGLVLWQATQGDTSGLEVGPIIIALLGGTLWFMNRDSRLQCAAMGITNPRNYFANEVDESRSPG